MLTTWNISKKEHLKTKSIKGNSQMKKWAQDEIKMFIGNKCKELTDP